MSGPCGACWEGPGGRRQQYDWNAFRSTVRELQPHAVMFSDTGPDLRWVGNESGVAGETCRSLLDTAGFTPGAGAPPVDTLQCGNTYGSAWIPAESDVSIRPGWFWRESENGSLKSVDELFDIYCSSVGRNSLLLLNVPPDVRGRIPEGDSLRLMEFRSRLDAEFSEDLASGARVRTSSARAMAFKGANVLNCDYCLYWAAGDSDAAPVLELSLPWERKIDKLVIQEYIPLGQRIDSFEVEALCPEGWQIIGGGTTIGYKRILRFEPVLARAVRVRFTSFRACPVISRIGLYCYSPDTM